MKARTCLPDRDLATVAPAQSALALMDSDAIGILGGTFDPIHIAHLRLAIEAHEALSLAQVLFVPAGQPPLRHAPEASANQRLAMVALALAGMPEYATVFTLDDTEIVTRSPSYTITTLARLRAHFGSARPLVLLMGEDAFAKLPLWHRWEELFSLAHIAVATRPGQGHHAAAQALSLRANEDSRGGLGKVGPGEAAATWLLPAVSERFGLPADIKKTAAGRIVPFAITPLAVSATLIRQRLAAGKSIRHLVSDSVLDYIATHSIY